MLVRLLLPLLVLPMLMTGCSPGYPEQERKSGSDAGEAARRIEAVPPRSPQERALQAEMDRLGEGFPGTIGIAVRDIESGWTAQYNGTDYFPQQSVSKLWVALAALEQVDRGELELSRKVTLRPGDLTVFYQPVRSKVLRPEGFTTTARDLLVRAITQSDNTANDYLMRLVGGAEAVRRTLADKDIAGIRFGPGERSLQSAIAGLEWRPEYSLGRNFYDARDKLQPAARHQAFEHYLADPPDGATPLAVVDALARLQQGALLSSASTNLLLEVMKQARSGQRRLKGGVPAGWSIGHKTGTGQELAGVQAGYNDVGILTSPSGRSYAIAVLMGRTSIPLPDRMALMQRVVEATVEYENASRGLATTETETAS